MPYAANGKVSSDPFEGAIEITYEQYQMAIEGMMEGKVVSIDGGFSVEFPLPPEVPPKKPPTLEELRLVAIDRRDGLMITAILRATPLQDVVDLGEATAAEEAELLAWKHYRVALYRIDKQVGFPTVIDWPVAPTAI